MDEDSNADEKPDIKHLSTEGEQDYQGLLVHFEQEPLSPNSQDVQDVDDSLTDSNPAVETVFPNRGVYRSADVLERMNSEITDHICNTVRTDDSTCAGTDLEKYKISDTKEEDCKGVVPSKERFISEFSPCTNPEATDGTPPTDDFGWTSARRKNRRPEKVDQTVNLESSESEVETDAAEEEMPTKHNTNRFLSSEGDADACGAGELLVKISFQHHNVETLDGNHAVLNENICESSVASAGGVTIEDGQHRCDVCDKCFASRSYLTIHKRKHSGIRPYKCPDCDKSFTYSSGLVVHKRSHTGETPYQCDMCDKSFAFGTHLTAHKRIHSGERPYKCDECDKCFKISGHLIEHKRIHSGLKPYTCEICNQSFTTNTSFTRHMRKHSGARPYPCDECDKTFITSSYLIVHKRQHSGQRPYKCEACGKGFASSSNLARHKTKTQCSIIII